MVIYRPPNQVLGHASHSFGPGRPQYVPMISNFIAAFLRRLLIRQAYVIYTPMLMSRTGKWPCNLATPFKGRHVPPTRKQSQILLPKTLNRIFRKYA